MAVENSIAATAEPRDRALKLIQQGKRDEALATIQNDYRNSCDTFQNDLEALIAYGDQMAVSFYEEGVSIRNFCILLFSILAIVSVGLMMVLTVNISKSLTRPIIELEGAMQKLSKGDLKATVTYSSRDELGSLADSLRTVSRPSRSQAVPSRSRAARRRSRRVLPSRQARSKSLPRPSTSFPGRSTIRPAMHVMSTTLWLPPATRSTAATSRWAT